MDFCSQGAAHTARGAFPGTMLGSSGHNPAPLVTLNGGGPSHFLLQQGLDGFCLVLAHSQPLTEQPPQLSLLDLAGLVLAVMKPGHW